MTIAIIAHDGKKADMVAFIKDHTELFQKKHIQLIATGTTGSRLEKAGLEVQKMESGPMGGDAQIASRRSAELTPKPGGRQDRYGHLFPRSAG